MSSPARVRDHITINGIELTDRDVHMVRASLADLAGAADATAVLPGSALPSGYRLRTYRPGDARIWVELVRAAEPFFVIHDDLFDRQFSAHAAALPDRMFFVETAAGEPVGTTTAWWQPNWRNCGDWGQIHWVAVHPAHQGRGLSKPLMARALRRMAQDHRRAMLGTSTGRVWAIKVYLDYGFRPDPQELGDANVRAAWRALHRVLPHPALTAALDAASA